MPKYNVHLFREMRLYFPGIEAESQAEAARIAAETDSCEAEEVEDCNGADLGAMVDVVGDRDFSRSALIDFEPARMAKLAPELAAALKTVVEMEHDRDEESRNFDEERLQHFSALIAQAEEMHPSQRSPIDEKETPINHEEIRKNHYERLKSYRHSAEYAEYAKAIGAEIPQGDLPSLIGNRWEIDGDTYHEFLGMLPPLEQRGDSFYLSEFTFNDITTKYTKDGDKYYCEFARFPAREESRTISPITKPDESDHAWRVLENDIVGSLNIIAVADIEGPRSTFSRPLFVNSIVGKVARLAEKGEVALVDKALALVRSYNDAHKKPAISDRHKFWTFADLAREKAGVHAATSAQEPETVAVGDGVDVINNHHLDRIQIVFAAKPSIEIIGKLKDEGWHWSRTEGAWQRKLTEAARQSAKRIVGLG